MRPGLSPGSGATPQAGGPAPDHWADLGELGSAWGLSFLYQVHRRLGRWPFRVALAPVVLWFLAFAPARRRASREFLRRAGFSGPLAVARHFWSFAEAVLDKLVAWNGGIRLADADFPGREAVEECFARGQGVLLVGSHLGNLEVCRVLARLRPGLRVHVLVHTRHAGNFNRLLRRLDPAAALNLVEVGGFGAAEAAHLSARIREGEVVLIAGDRRPLGAGRVVAADFLGAPARFAAGPWALAAALGCPVFLIFCLKRGRRYEVRFEPFAQRLELPRSGREEALTAAVRRYAGRLEERCREDPLQWFNFFPFWG